MCGIVFLVKQNSEKHMNLFQASREFCHLSGHHSLHGALDAVWLPPSVLHVGNDLIRQLFEHLLCKIAFPKALVELDKLYDISAGSNASSAQKTAIRVKLLHHSKVGIAHANNNHTAR